MLSFGQIFAINWLCGLVNSCPQIFTHEILSIFYTLSLESICLILIYLLAKFILENIRSCLGLKMRIPLNFNIGWFLIKHLLILWFFVLPLICIRHTLILIDSIRIEPLPRVLWSHLRAIGRLSRMTLTCSRLLSIHIWIVIPGLMHLLKVRVLRCLFVELSHQHIVAVAIDPTVYVTCWHDASTQTTLWPWIVGICLLILYILSNWIVPIEMRWLGKWVPVIAIIVH